MSVRYTCGSCGYGRAYRSTAQADYHHPRHSCQKELARQASRRRGRARQAAVDRTPKPCLHKIARHQHGTHACYVLDRCKCRPCSAATAAYEKRRAKDRAYGRQAYVDAQPAREHVLALRAAGMGLKQVAKVAGVPHGAISKLIYGDPVRGLAPSRRIRSQTAAKLQSVRADISTLAGGAFVDATGTHRRAQALVTIGWSQSKICARIGMDRGNWYGVMRRDRVSARTARAVTALYDELWNTPPAEQTPREKATATRARKEAAARGWLPPLAWDDETIDDPAATPDLGNHQDGDAHYTPDEIRIERIAAGTLRVPPSTKRDPDRDEAIRRLASAGMSDRAIAERIASSAAAVMKIRFRNNIPAGIPTNRATSRRAS